MCRSWRSCVRLFNHETVKDSEVVTNLLVSGHGPKFIWIRPLQPMRRKKIAPPHILIHDTRALNKLVNLLAVTFLHVLIQTLNQSFILFSLSSQYLSLTHKMTSSLDQLKETGTVSSASFRRNWSYPTTQRLTSLLDIDCRVRFWRFRKYAVFADGAGDQR